MVRAVSLSMPSITVDIWSDIACPWCFIGKRRFESALKKFAARDEIEITFHSFELAPDTPSDYAGSEVDFLVSHKGMAPDQVRKMLAQVTEIAASEGLKFDFDSVQHANTNRAHQLLHFAKTQGKQTELNEVLLSAYFEQGRNVGSIDELVELAVSVGIDAAGARDALETGVFEASVREDIEQSQQIGVTAVPFFVFNRKYGVSGAQDSSTFLEVLEQVQNEG